MQIMYCNSCEKWVEDFQSDGNGYSCGNCGEDTKNTKIFDGDRCSICGELAPVSEMTKNGTADDFDYVCSYCVEEREEAKDRAKDYRDSYL
jgi:hypothetical protein